jgi:hypothetical protein
MTYAQDNAPDVNATIQYIRDNPPDFTPAGILSLLPPELRRVELNGSFAGFDASAVFLLLSPDELAQEFARRTRPPTTPGSLQFNFDLSTDPPAIGNIDSKQLLNYRPGLPSHDKPVHIPADPQNSLVDLDLFESFTASDIQALKAIQPSTDAAAVVVGAQVRVFDTQAYHFLGCVYTDGHFDLISAATVEPLSLSVAGIQINVPLDIRGRITLRGLASSVDSYAKVSAQVTGEWNVIPGLENQSLALLQIGKVQQRIQPAALTLDSRGHFAVLGAGHLRLFNGAAIVSGTLDISHTHCYVDGTFSYRSQTLLGGRPLLELSLSSQGRIGPGFRFELSGNGTLRIADNTISNVRGVVSDGGAEIEAAIDTGNWNLHGLPVNRLRMALWGKIDISQPRWPEFLLEGDTDLQVFGSSRPGSGVAIKGKGGIASKNANLTTFVEGRLIWQGIEWLGGRVELGTKGVSIEGRSSFTLPMLAIPSQLKKQIGSLFMTLDIGGRFSLDKYGTLTNCQLTGQWMLAVKLPRATEQVIPIGMQGLNIHFAIGSRAPRPGTSDLVIIHPLVSIDKLTLLPVDDIVLPVPTLTAKQSKALFLSVDKRSLSTKLTAPRIVSGSSSSADYSIPYEWQAGSKKINLIWRIRSAFNALVEKLPGPPPFKLPTPPSGTKAEITVPEFKVTKKIGIDASYSYPVNLGTLPLPNLSTTPPTFRAKPLIEVPTDFDLKWQTSSLGTLLNNLNFSLALGWRNSDLGIIVQRGTQKTFTPLRSVLGDS